VNLLQPDEQRSLMVDCVMPCPLIFSRNTFTSEIATAMSPELQALEALKNESLLHCKVVQRVDELSEKHVRDYDALREKQYQELVKVSKTSSVTSLQYVSIVLRKSRLHDS
jgi:hypothetical protein